MEGTNWHKLISVSLSEGASTHCCFFRTPLFCLFFLFCLLAELDYPLRSQDSRPRFGSFCSSAKHPIVNLKNKGKLR